MIKKTKKAPAIRFRGFTEDWEQHKLSDIFSDFIVPMRDKPKAFGGDIPWTRIEDIEGKYLNGTLSSQYVTEETIKKMNLKIIPNGSLIVSSSATFGVIAIVTNDLITNQTFIGLVPKEKATLDYWYTYFHSYEARKYMMLQSAGSTIFYISRKSFENMPALTPSISEMIKIGEYFNNLDNLITLHQRKFDQLKTLKKYFLQNMFPAKGEKVPRIRFKGFTGDWEQKKLIDVCDYVDYRGKTPSKTTSGIFLVTAKNIKDGYIDYEASQEYISENDYDEVMHRGKPKIGDVLITTEAPCGNVAQVDKESIALAQRIIKYRGHSHVMDNAYLKYYLLSPEFQSILYAKSSGGTVQGIKGSILHQQKINFPKYEEQTKIGQYLDDLDNLITLHQRKLDQLQTMKKFMLQNMFI